MKYEQKTKLVLILISLSLLFLPMTSAFANTFLEDKTMSLWKGEIGEYCIYLQNTGEENLTRIINIFEGEEYIQNLKEIQIEFEVSPETISDEFPVCMEVKLPNNAKKNKKYLISYGVTSVSYENEAGVVSFSPLQIKEKFYLTKKSNKKSNSTIKYLLLSLGGVLILLVIFIKIGEKKNGN